MALPHYAKPIRKWICMKRSPPPQIAIILVGIPVSPWNRHQGGLLICTKTYDSSRLNVPRQVVKLLECLVKEILNVYVDTIPI